MIVKYTKRGGRDGDKEKADLVLELNKEYTISGGAVYGYSSYYELEGVDGTFNTCLFDEDLSEVIDKYGEEHFFSIVSLRC